MVKAVKKRTSTPLRLEKFDQSVRYWLARLGVSGWDIVVTEMDLGPSKYNTVAEVVANCTNMNACFALNTAYKPDETSQLVVDLHKRALHEAIHLLLWELTESAHVHGTTHRTTVGIEHGVLNRLLDVIYEQ